MVTTHAASGAAVAALLVPVAPRLAGVVALAALAGSVLPDLDVLVGQHRRTLHYPGYYTALATAAGVLALVRPGVWTAVLAGFLAGAALHSLADALGGGLAARPWVRDDGRGVYCHARGRWVAPHHWVRWDGAPEDLAAYVAFATVAAVTFPGPVRWLLAAGLPLSAGYVLVRRRLPDLAPWLV